MNPMKPMKPNCWLLCTAFFLSLAAGQMGRAAVQDETSDELITMVVGLLRDQDKELRALGLEQVRTQVKGEAATRQFASLLPKLPPDAQVGLIRALADRGDKSARSAVLEMLAAGGEEPVKVAAIEAFGQLGEPADLPLLSRLLSEGSQLEQAAARGSLVRLPGEPVPALIVAELKSAASPKRVTLIEILAARRAFGIIPDLLTAAVDDDPPVRAAAMTALGQLAGPEHLPGMIQGVLKAEDGKERVAAEKSVMFVCGRVENEQLRTESLLGAVSALSEDDRLAILPTLGRVGGLASRQIVEAALADSDPVVHGAGLRALCSWPDASVADRLTELIASDEHPEHRTQALRALIRIAPLPDGRSDAEKLALIQRAIALCADDAERNLVLQRAAAIRMVETLRFLVPYLDQPAYAQQACESVVELAHYRDLRQPHKAEFDQALDHVMRISQDATVIDRANRYKKGQTWVRPKTPARNR